MKHKLQLLICCLLLSIGAFSQNIPAYLPTNGLVGYWPFNGNANDESGNGNHGTVNGATLTSDRNGVANCSYSFNGNSITIPHSNHLNLKNSFSISFWYLSNSNYFAQDLLMKGPDYLVNSWWIRHHTYSADPNVNFAFKPNSIGADQVGFPFPTQNTWNLVVAIAENNSLKIYQNGVLKNTILNVVIPATNSNTSNLIVGTLQYGFSGKIDDIAIYNRALTQQEITALYTGVPPCTPTSSTTNLSIPSTSLPYTWNGLTFNNSGSQTATLTNAKGCDSSVTLNLTVTNTIPNYLPTNGLVGYWPFNGNANDESGNGNHGTVNGATLTSDRNGNSRKAYSFDGVSDMITANPNLPVGSLPRSMMTWVNTNSTTSVYPGVMCIVAYGSSSSGLVIFPHHISLPNGKSYFESGSSSNQLYSRSLINDGNWHQIVTTYNGANSRVNLFVDGIIQDSTQFLTLNTVSSSLVIGNAPWANVPFKGVIDDIAIYNRALTQQEITQLYTGTVTYSINASSGANGTISPSGSTSVNSGASQTYTFTPNSGYWIDSVIVNGTKVPTASSYTFSNVTSNQSIRVTYRSLAAALAAANICANDTTVATVNLPATTNVRATTYYSNIYLFNQSNTGNAYKYNVNDRKYTAIADKPTPCVECGVAESNGKIYCFNTNGTTQAYDIASNTWQTKTSLPTGTVINIGFYATSLNNKIYLMGGSLGLTQTAFYEYNPATNVFTQLSNPSQPNVHGRILTYQNLIYKIGGEYYDGSNSLAVNTFEIYNPSTNTWNLLPSLPEALSRVGATVYDNKIYVFGGNVPYGPSSNKVYVFDIASNAWYLESNVLPRKIIEIEAKTANNMVFLLGGNDTTNSSTNKQALRYFCKDQLCTCKWAEYVCNGVSQSEPCPIPTPTINSLSQDTTANTGSLYSGTTSTNTTVTLNYTGANGANYNARTIASTGVTGLTATLAAGSLNNGNGTLTLNITGTPNTNGIASFTITIGGKNCVITREVNIPIGSYRPGTVFCNGTPTAVVDVTNPTTGKTWMDRNLGATQAATSSTDADAYGDLYQWGRGADGHQCRNSATTLTLSSTDQPANSNFIRANNSPYDWRTPQNDNLWQGVNGINNPCPTGYRLPTYTELNAERSSWSQNDEIGAFGSPLKLPVAGYRSYSDGSLNWVGSEAYYWSSTVNGTDSKYLHFISWIAGMYWNDRAYGFSVRCLKD